MKKCSQCGREYPDDITACPQDGQPLTAQPPPAAPDVFPQSQVPPASGLAITSLVLGIVSLVMCGPFSAVPAVICGHIALSRSKMFPTKYGGAGMAIAGLVTGYIGFVFTTIFMVAVMAGLLLPALAKAKEKAVEINCVNNLKQVGLAARIWAGDHNETLPQNFLEMTNELANPRILICPADPNHKQAPYGAPMAWDPTNITYVFLKPGEAMSNVENQVIVRCPIHGTELLGDGSVHIVRKKPPSN